MILTAHLLIGAIIAAKIKIVPLVILLAFLSHYLLDFVPHIEYSTKNIKEKQWRISLPDFLKVILDFSVGLFLILIFFQKQPIIFIGAFFAIVSDGFTILSKLLPNRVLKLHDNFDRKIHFLENKKIPAFLRITSQVLMIFLVILLL